MRVNVDVIVVAIAVRIAIANKSVLMIALVVVRKARLVNVQNKVANVKYKIVVAVKNMYSRFLENLNVNVSR